MGFFDFLKGKSKEKNESVENACKDIVPSFEMPRIPEVIRNLLWIAEGKYKNYTPDITKNILFKNELFTIESSIFTAEPSAIFTKLPVNPKSECNPEDSIGYFPTYGGLSPDQRWVYLQWLCDIRKPVDIGYVFIFYYGLERHLVYGRFQEAVNTILLLKQYHKNNSFQSYSSNALIMSAIIHKDKDLLIKILDNIEDKSYHGNSLLIAKYLMKLDLTAKEIISLSSRAGFKNNRYIKNYPDLFEKKISYLLSSVFEKNALPFINLETTFDLKEEIVFANISFPHEIRSPALPSITDNEVFKKSIYDIVSSAHELLKTDLSEMKKMGIKPTKIEIPKRRRDVGRGENESKVLCPYCKTALGTPKRKKKCPHCSNYIHVKPKQNLFSSIYLTEDQVIELYKFEGAEHFKSQYEGEKARLLGYKREGFEKVKIFSTGECPACIEMINKVLKIDDALRDMPIPVKNCTFKLHGEIPSWCRCMYVAYFERD